MRDAFALVALCCGAWALGMAAASCSAAEGQQAITDETLALDLTEAACSPADATGNPYVIVTCAIAQALEDGSLSITKVLVAVPVGQVAAFIGNAPGARRVTKSMLVPFVSLKLDAGAG